MLINYHPLYDMLLQCWLSTIQEEFYLPDYTSIWLHGVCPKPLLHALVGCNCIILKIQYYKFTSLASVSGSHFHFLLNSIYYFLKLFHLIIFSFDYNVGWWICISFSGLFYISSPYPSNWWCCIFNYAAYQKKPNKSTKRKTRQAKALENAKKAPRTFLELLQEVRAKNGGAVARFLLLTAAIK